MDLRKLKTLIDLVSESNVSELEITEAEGKVRIVKAGGKVWQSARIRSQAGSAPSASHSSRTMVASTGGCVMPEVGGVRPVAQTSGPGK